MTTALTQPGFYEISSGRIEDGDINGEYVINIKEFNDIYAEIEVYENDVDVKDEDDMAYKFAFGLGVKWDGCVHIQWPEVMGHFCTIAEEGGVLIKLMLATKAMAYDLMNEYLIATQGYEFEQCGGDDDVPRNTYKLRPLKQGETK